MVHTKSPHMLERERREALYEIELMIGQERVQYECTKASAVNCTRDGLSAVN
jgi:hypothetical protein